MSNLSPAPTWHALSLAGRILHTHEGTVEYPPQGTLVPLLETELGEPVVAVWLSTDEVERRYIVPAETPWKLLVDWLSRQALPEYVPEAMQRARRHLDADPDLMTSREQRVRAKLDDLESGYLTRKADLSAELEVAVAHASPVRTSLLYGTGQQLVDGVRTVLERAGVEVVDLDVLLGDSKNADLLCVYAGRSVLVEVKSAAGSAPERAYEDLMRHLREWPHLPGVPTVEGGALIINHQHRSVPRDRSSRPYSRPEFLAAQTEPVVTSLALLESWRTEDWPAVRRLLFGDKESDDAESPSSLTVEPQVHPEPTKKAPRWSWFKRQR